MSKKKYFCPRCGNEKVIIFVESFECPTCKSKFMKDHFDTLDHDSILSVEEILSFIRIIKKK